jgi:hypothetical protein
MSSTFSCDSDKSFFDNHVHMEISYIQQLHSKFIEWEKLKLDHKYWITDAFDDAVIKGDFDLIKWLLANSCPFSPNTFELAVEYGNLDILKWLKVTKCPFSPHTFSFAAGGGDLKILEWLKSSGCKFDLYTMSSGAVFGNLNNLKWLRASGCDWGKFIFNDEIMLEIKSN